MSGFVLDLNVQKASADLAAIAAKFLK